MRARATSFIVTVACAALLYGCCGGASGILSSSVVVDNYASPFSQHSPPSEESRSVFRFLYPNQNQPTKGDKEDCISSDGQSMPCRGYENIDNLEGGSGESYYFNPQFPYTAEVDVYVGLKSSAQSVGHRLVSVVSIAMNKSFDQGTFFLPPHFQDEDASQSIADGNWRSPEDDCNRSGNSTTADGTTASGSSTDDCDSGARRRRYLQSGHPVLDREYKMYYAQTYTAVMEKRQERWWWRYSIIYNCFWADTDTPIGAVPLRQGMSRNMTRWVRANRQPILEYLQSQVDDDLLELTVNQEDIGEPPRLGPQDDTADMGGSESFTSSILQPVDARAWDWHRYLGLALFVTACSSVLILAQLGAMRQRRRIHKQVWSNLASEEGVKQLLNTGWVLRDNRMEVYDKSKYGYKDDESMLIGGFEQKEAVVGTEITFNPTGSEKTPRSLNSSDLKSLPSQGNR